MQAIIYIQETGIPAFILPTPEGLQQFTLEQICQKDVPAGKNYKIVDVEKLPLSVPQHRWIISESDLDNQVDDGSFNISIAADNTVKSRFLPLEFLELFTQEEQLAVASAAMTIPEVKLWYDKMLAASYVDLTDVRTAAGLSALIDAGLFTQTRIDEILNAI